MGEYRYDLRVLRERAARLKAALPHCTILYAVKANGHPTVVNTLAAIVDGLDVASIGELNLAVNHGRGASPREEQADPPGATAGSNGRIVCGGPAKSRVFLEAAAAAGATVNVESLTELHRIGDLPLTITLRVARPADVGGTHDMSRGQFGVAPEDLDAAVALARSMPNLDLVGWHLHSVSNNLDVNVHNDFIAGSLEWAVSAAATYGFDLRQVNLGGGFGVGYQDEAEFDPALLRVPRLDGVEVVFEPGRWLVADAGSYAAEVVDLKRNQGRWFAVIRGGMHQFRTPVAYGISWPFTVVPGPGNVPGPVVRDAPIDVVGELCTPNDVLARDQHVSELRVGDVIVFPKAGAYAWDISPHQYLRHPSPDLVILS